MSNPIRRLVCGLSVVGLCAALPAVSYAQSRFDLVQGGAPSVRDDVGLSRTPLPERLGNVPVDTAVTRMDAAGCRFVSRAQGRLRVLRTREVGTQPGRVVYTPHVTVRSDLFCPGQAPRTLVVRRVSGGIYSPRQLERALGSRASAVTNTVQPCRYSPTFVFSGNGQLVSEGVAESCAYGRGGGPRGRR